eukprot:TRINITY_DN1188_c0_g1_i4.p1 TRINITY_DN1188_c0_g1~~TRINITY_DN1188_c0_g1_i4.p1  ORF type:complete len:151 (-),score=37.09 TRINITY_DN1188_c0_g1_i4:172-624(-)
MKLVLTSSRDTVSNFAKSICAPDQTSLEKMVAFTRYINSHKENLIDYCLIYFNSILDEFKVIHELSNQRLLYLERKLVQCQALLLSSIDENKKNIDVPSFRRLSGSFHSSVSTISSPKDRSISSPDNSNKLPFGDDLGFYDTVSKKIKLE